MLSSEILIDCLDVACAIYGKHRSEMMTDLYLEALADIEDQLVVGAFKIIINDPYFPQPKRIRELATRVTEDADWLEILHVASGRKASAQISGISEIALKTIGGLRRIATIEEAKTHHLKTEWLKLVSIPPDPSKLPPAAVLISLEPVKKSPPNDVDYHDDDYAIRTEAMLSNIKRKGAISSAWIAIINTFPPDKCAEIYHFAKINMFSIAGSSKTSPLGVISSLERLSNIWQNPTASDLKISEAEFATAQAIEGGEWKIN